MSNGARTKLREYFLNNPGKVLTSSELQKITGISEWAPRVRERRAKSEDQIKALKWLMEKFPDETLKKSS